ncbi:PepSY domain-containing protein [Allofustis seminis]|uniref:PepSY domain-containing protein n=1 Tax=Allofustis seminis TaxID=166939 RepID=UPI0012E9B30D
MWPRICASCNYFKKKSVNPDHVLATVKKAFKEDGPIEGSWIEMTTAPWDRYAYHTSVYYGGITRLEDGEPVQYEFIADAHTGTLMNIYKV